MNHASGAAPNCDTAKLFWKPALSSSVVVARKQAQEHPMDMDRDNSLNANRMNTTTDRDTVVYDRDGGASNFMAFLIGGLVIAVGLLAFLFYDGGNTRDVTTTSSTIPRIERPAGETGSAPSMPSRPAPATPANPQ
jgi:hypothetical protein